LRSPLDNLRVFSCVRRAALIALRLVLAIRRNGLVNAHTVAFCNDSRTSNGAV